MQTENRQKLLLLGKVTLFLIIYIVLITVLFDVNIVGQIFPTLYRPLYMVMRGCFYLLVGLVLLTLFVKIIDKKNLISAEWISLKNRYEDFFIGGLFGSICIFAAFLFTAIFYWHQIEIVPLKIDAFVLPAFFMGFCIALLEECVFRGYILRQLLNKFSPLAALLLSTVPFAALHFLFYDNLSIIMVIIAIMNLTLAGILLGLLYLKTKNIWLAVGFHTFWNYAQSMYNLNAESINLFEFVCAIILILSIIFFYKRYATTFTA